jgi:hypothetical protein
MKIVIFETTEAVFSFSLTDVTAVLKSHASENEALETMDFLKVQNSAVVEIPQEKKPFLFAVLALLASNKGSVFCKICEREYQASEVISFPVGAGENLLKVKVGYGHSLFNRILGRRKRMPLLGGKCYRCPKGHEVIGMVTWRT